MSFRHAFSDTLTQTGGTEGEALLNNVHLSIEDDDTSILAESMTTRLKTAWSGDKSFADGSGDGSELALENLGAPHDLDDANLRAQGHEAALQRSFSPLAAISLGFR